MNLILLLPSRLMYVSARGKKKDLTKYGFPEVSDKLKMPREAKFTTADKLPTMPLSVETEG